MKINLNEIPDGGREYKFDRSEKELTACLDDLIKKAPYTTEFFIRPLTARDFELKGWIKTETPEVCSRCGAEFQFKINAKFHEFLLPKLDQPRGSRYAHVNHISDLTQVDGPEMTEYEGTEFDLGEYLHEVVGLAAPFNVAHPQDGSVECKIYENPEATQGFSVNKDIPLEKPESPFAALKNIKLN